MKVLLVLACDGVIEEDFTICPGVENTILDLEKVARTKNYKDLVSYLDKVPKLFEEPCICKTNIITNTMYKVHELGYISERRYNVISHFIKAHFKHGLILKLDVVDEQ